MERKTSTGPEDAREPIRQIVRDHRSVLDDYERMRALLGQAVRLVQPQDFLADPDAMRVPEGARDPGPGEGDWRSAWNELVRLTYPFHL